MPAKAKKATEEVAVPETAASPEVAPASRYQQRKAGLRTRPRRNRSN